jgi:hypothetical protein
VAIVSLAIGVFLLAAGAMIGRAADKPMTPVNRPATAEELAEARARVAELMKEQRRNDEAK